MKFAIVKIILWLKNNKIREISFKPNKVNVIMELLHYTRQPVKLLIG